MKPPKKTKAQFKKHLQTIIDRYVPILGLERHRISIKEDDDPDSYFACTFRYPYLDFTVLYSGKSFLDWAKGRDITHYVVHELCHQLTDPLYSKATHRFVSQKEIENERELLTDVISNIVLRLTDV